MYVFEYAHIAALAQEDVSAVTLSPNSWAICMLALTNAAQLELWNVLEEDVDALDNMLAIALDELMGMTIGGGLVAGMPWFVPAVLCYFYAGRSPVFAYVDDTYFTNSYVYTNDVNTNANLTWLRAQLSPGDYVLEVVHSTAYNEAKFAVVCPALDLDEVRDCYTAALVKVNRTSFVFTVAEAGSYTIEINRLQKNPLSSGAYLVFQSFSIREQAGEE